LWRSSAYRIHSYQLVEGTIVAAGEGRGRLYLNFAEDWRRRALSLRQAST